MVHLCTNIGAGSPYLSRMGKASLKQGKNNNAGGASPWPYLHLVAQGNLSM
jgi:hypothetical protein